MMGGKMCISIKTIPLLFGAHLRYIEGFFYDTQYNPVPLVEKDPYVIKKDIYLKI
jgi:hypothetical protein